MTSDPQALPSTALRAEAGPTWTDSAPLLQRIAELERDKQDLEIALATAVEHGDAIEAELEAAVERLRQEVRERMAAEARLQALLASVDRRREDLEVLVATITEHGDEIEAQWQSRYAEVEAMAWHDGLTGIANRRAFDAALEKEWRRCGRHDLPLTVVLCDVDYFKQFNDRLGHSAGDEALVAVAEALREATGRASDLAARYGGEEFVLLLPHVDLAAARQVADRIRSALARRAIAHPASPYGVLTLSIGIASTLPPVDGDPIALVVDADRLLYLAKKEGRNTVRWTETRTEGRET